VAAAEEHVEHPRRPVDGAEGEQHILASNKAERE